MDYRSVDADDEIELVHRRGHIAEVPEIRTQVAHPERGELRAIEFVRLLLQAVERGVRDPHQVEKILQPARTIGIVFMRPGCRPRRNPRACRPRPR